MAVVRFLFLLKATVALKLDYLLQPYHGSPCREFGPIFIGLSRNVDPFQTRQLYLKFTLWHQKSAEPVQGFGGDAGLLQSLTGR